MGWIQTHDLPVSGQTLYHKATVLVITTFMLDTIIVCVSEAVRLVFYWIFIDFESSGTVLGSTISKTPMHAGLRFLQYKLTPLFHCNEWSIFSTQQAIFFKTAFVLSAADSQWFKIHFRINFLYTCPPSAEKFHENTFKIPKTEWVCNWLHGHNVAEQAQTLHHEPSLAAVYSLSKYRFSSESFVFSPRLSCLSIICKYTFSNSGKKLLYSWDMV